MPRTGGRCVQVYLMTFKVRHHSAQRLDADDRATRELGRSTSADQRTAAAILASQREPALGLARDRNRRAEPHRDAFLGEAAQHVRMHLRE